MATPTAARTGMTLYPFTPFTPPASSSPFSSPSSSTSSATTPSPSALSSPLSPSPANNRTFYIILVTLLLSLLCLALGFPIHNWLKHQHRQNTPDANTRTLLARIAALEEDPGVMMPEGSDTTLRSEGVGRGMNEGFARWLAREREKRKGFVGVGEGGRDKDRGSGR
ncbi:MAG: hypothetical protein Q9220_001888 [cf. Caloplaca sp. 1 TL-2023]